jgi:hypothetical protein
LRANEWQTPVVAGSFCEVDLGEISLTEKITGTQKWLGQVEAYSTNVAAKDVFHIDYLTFVPLEGYGKARGVASLAPGTITSFDNFTTGTLSGSLNTRTPAIGAAWATSVATTDWTVSAGKVERKTTGDTEPRFGVLGSAIGNSSITVAMTAPKSYAGTVTLGAILRWVDASNYAFIQVEQELSGAAIAKLGVRVAGVTTILASSAVAPAGSFLGPTAAMLTATLDGALSGTITVGQVFALSASSTAIATGGALASGKAGVLDKSAGASVAARLFTSVSAKTLAAIPYVVQSERSMEVRSDSSITADSTGTYFGPVPQYRGARFYIPQDGSVNRTSRILVKADRNDLEESDQQKIGDSFTVAAFATPRYSTIPR